MGEISGQACNTGEIWYYEVVITNVASFSNDSQAL